MYTEDEWENIPKIKVTITPTSPGGTAGTPTLGPGPPIVNSKHPGLLTYRTQADETKYEMKLDKYNKYQQTFHDTRDFIEKTYKKGKFLLDSENQHGSIKEHPQDM